MAKSCPPLPPNMDTLSIAKTIIDLQLRVLDPQCQSHQLNLLKRTPPSPSMVGGEGSGKEDFPIGMESEALVLVVEEALILEKRLLLFSG
ncbi:hypothetical protein ACH5RR_028810 [Cinchona calisaya]|uniref:Uncharacterized protein n=1 Tax=Cinchona calisaya TaxID=153742 RepID=A0ABD2YTE9_9GENT